MNYGFCPADQSYSLKWSLSVTQKRISFSPSSSVALGFLLPIHVYSCSNLSYGVFFVHAYLEGQNTMLPKFRKKINDWHVKKLIRK